MWLVPWDRRDRHVHLRPGARSELIPYHFEYEEEWLLVIDGTIVVRAPNGERTLERGSLVFPRPVPPGRTS